MKQGQNIKYIHAPDKVLFPDDDVAELVNILNNVDSVDSGVRHRIALALKKQLGASHNTDEIDPKHGPIEQMGEFRDKGNTIIAKDGKKTIGMIGFEELPAAPNGQRIFEIRRTTVLEAYRGGGIGRILRENMIKRLQEIDPDAILLSRIHTDNIVNQNLAASTRFTKISDEEMKGFGAPDYWIQDQKSSGYEFYVFNPRNEQKES